MKIFRTENWNVIFLIQIAVLLCSCTEEQFATISKRVARNAPEPVITSVTTTNDEIVVIGENLESTSSLKIKDPNSSFEKDFQIVLKEPTKVIGKNIETTPISANILLDLIISTAQAETTYPITFIPGADSISTGAIVDDAITRDKIQDGAITESKLSAAPGGDGDVLSLNGSGELEWIDAGVAAAPAAATGTVNSILVGLGLVGIPNPIVDSGSIDVDIGETGDLSSIKIPYFNPFYELVLDSTINETKLVFREASSTSFSLYNDGSLKVINEVTPEDLMIIEGNGDVTISGDLAVEGSSITVSSVEVCLEDGTNCPPGGGGGINSITTSPPLAATGTTDITISLDVGTKSGEVLQFSVDDQLPALDGSLLTDLPSSGIQSITATPPLAATGTTNSTLSLDVGTKTGEVLQFLVDDQLPALDGSLLTNLPGGNINSVNSGPGLLGGGSTGDITLEVDFTQVQASSDSLADLGQLNPNKDWVIIGDGTNFQVQGGLTLHQSIGLEPGVDVMAYSDKLQDIADDNLPSINFQTGNYTLVANDCGNTVSLSNAGSINLILSALRVGCIVNVVQSGTGVVTVVAGGGVNPENAFGLFRTRTQYSVISIQVMSAASAVISGDVN